MLHGHVAAFERRKRVVLPIDRIFRALRCDYLPRETGEMEISLAGGEARNGAAATTAERLQRW